jgi:hypothetical protein
MAQGKKAKGREGLDRRLRMQGRMGGGDRHGMERGGRKKRAMMWGLQGEETLLKAMTILHNTSALLQVEQQLLWRSALLGDGPAVRLRSIPLPCISFPKPKLPCPRPLVTPPPPPPTSVGHGIHFARDQSLKSCMYLHVRHMIAGETPHQEARARSKHPRSHVLSRDGLAPSEWSRTRVDGFEAVALRGRAQRGDRRRADAPALGCEHGAKQGGKVAHSIRRRRRH